MNIMQRLFAGMVYDYSRSCYDYSSRNATTIADLYWLSGDSPKRDAARAVNGSAVAGMVCPLIYIIIIGGCADLCSVPTWRLYLV